MNKDIPKVGTDYLFPDYAHTFTKDGRELKRAGQKQALGNEDPDWLEALIRALRPRLQFRGQRVTGDDIRAWAHQSGLMDPHHANVWGCILPEMARRGLVTRTKEFVASKQPSRRGGMIRVWEVR